MSFWAAFANMMLANRDKQEAEQAAKDDRLKSYFGGQIGEANLGKKLNVGNTSALFKTGMAGLQDMGNEAMLQNDAANAQEAIQRLDKPAYAATATNAPPYYLAKSGGDYVAGTGGPRQETPQGLSAQPSLPPYYLAAPGKPYDERTAPSLANTNNLEPYDLYQMLYGARTQLSDGSGAPWNGLHDTPPEPATDILAPSTASQGPSSNPGVPASLASIFQTPQTPTSMSPPEAGREVPYISAPTPQSRLFQPQANPSMGEMFRDVFGNRTASAQELQMFTKLADVRNQMQQNAVQQAQVQQAAFELQMKADEASRATQDIEGDRQFLMRHYPHLASQIAILGRDGVKKLAESVPDELKDMRTAERQRLQDERKDALERYKQGQQNYRKKLDIDAAYGMAQMKQTLAEKAKQGKYKMKDYWWNGTVEPTTKELQDLRTGQDAAQRMEDNVDAMIDMIDTASPADLASPEKVAKLVGTLQTYYQDNIYAIKNAEGMKAMQQAEITMANKTIPDPTAWTSVLDKVALDSAFVKNKLQQLKTLYRGHVDSAMSTRGFDPDKVTLFDPRTKRRVDVWRSQVTPEDMRRYKVVDPRAKEPSKEEVAAEYNRIKSPEETESVDRDREEEE